VFGAFLKIRPVKNLQFGLEAYNLFNSYASQGPAGFVGGSTTLVNAGVAQGRAVKGSIKFSF
jgi:outer membrane receptor protein involved in Fe transport